MKTIYISSTFDDLRDHRKAVYHTLKKMAYRVIAMDDYVAKDERTVKRCLEDVATCDYSLPKTVLTSTIKAISNDEASERSSN
jgi:hypothetical protein